MNLLVIGIFPFSEAGGGAIARARNLALALRLAGAQVGLWLVGETGSREFDWRGVGVQEFGRRAGGRGRINASAVEAMLDRLATQHTSGARVDAVLFYNQDLVYAWRCARLCRTLGITYVQQYAEAHLAADYPEGWRSTFFLLERFHRSVLPWMSEGAVVISHDLAALLGASSRRPTVVIPTVSEVPVPTAVALPDGVAEVICLTQGARRDDLPLLLRAMALRRTAGGRLRLRVVGLGKSARPRIEREVAALGLNDLVRVDGFLPDDVFASALAGASACVLLRTDDLSSRACFPSRLHELFGTGRPVVLSAVGDLPRYFEDRKHCLFVPAGDAKALAERLAWLETHPAEAAMIGRSGNARAAEVFAPRSNGLMLLRFLNSLPSLSSPHP